MTVRLLQGVGWLFIVAGVLVGLYLVYSLFFTNLETERAQSGLAEQWTQQIGALDRPEATAARRPDTPEPEDPETGSPEPSRSEDGEAPAPEAPAPEAADPGDALAVMEFRRPGEAEPIVHAEPLYVVEGVGITELQSGPGHYPETGLPGGPGNFAVAGHRTTYGAPFYHLDQLRPGDEVLVTDRSGRQHTYAVRSRDVVLPGDVWVIQPDPLETGDRMLTLTTCEPRFSDAERLIVFAELVA